MRDFNPSWQALLAQGFATAQELLVFLDLPIDLGNKFAEQQFNTRVPRGFAGRMQPKDRYDPLLLQVLAVAEELRNVDGFEHDPLQEGRTNTLPGLIQKYHGRVLLTLAGACAVNCRYCFRRHFPYTSNNPGRDGWRAVLEFIAGDPTIQEVILSGGEPLLVKDHILKELLSQLDDISHVQTVRVHTRMPVVLPERIDESFLRVFEATRLHKVIVLHCNHAQELDLSVQQACEALRNIGCHLLNQSVLLQGVNADANILANLSQRLMQCGVLPYYLHSLDQVQGAAHFAVSKPEALAIFHQLQSLLPGYLVPRFVQELPGKAHKTLMHSS